jgi:hypothetical protein
VTPAALAVLSSLVAAGEPGPIAEPALDTLEGIRIEVPFVAQGPLLCGGAAAAMVERFWGARGVYGEDFLHLVREEEEGIRASELTSALTDRGYAVRAIQGEPDRAFAAMEAGVPPILLLESGATRLHYVVLVGLEDDAIRIHDPNFGPAREITRAELMRRWRASDYWALVVTPSGAARTPPPDRASEPTRSSAEASERDRALAPGSRSAGASPPGATPEGAPTTSAVDMAMERLRTGDLEGARAAARDLLQADESEAAIGRRILATAWFLDGSRSRALEEWNALGEPVIDLVLIEGMAATRYRVAADRMSLEHGELLTSRSLALARRRLSQLPAVQASRVDYRPLPDGTVEVQASVLERRRAPGFAAVVAQAARGFLNRRVALEIGPLIAAGDRWRAAGRWEPGQRYLRGSVSAPAPPLPGVATVGVEWRRERFDLQASQSGAEMPALVTEKRRRGSLELQEWVHPRLRLGAIFAVESWEVTSWTPEPGDLEPGELEPGDAAARMVSGGLAARWATDDDTWLLARGERWTGSGRSFDRGSLEGGTTVPRGARREWRLRVGGIAVSRDAPRMIWPGAGSDRVREPLLRAHGLRANDAIGGPAFGRQLVHGTAEHRLFGDLGPTRLGASVFVDAAYARFRGGALRDRGFVDVGAGVFLEAGPDEVAVSLAHGSSGWRLSARIDRGR